MAVDDGDVGTDQATQLTVYAGKRANARSGRRRPSHSSPLFHPTATDCLIILHQPRCAETELAYKIIESLTLLKLTESWMSLLPSRIGHNRCIDQVADASVKASQYVASKNMSSGAHLVSYGKAINDIRSLLASTASSASVQTKEDALVAVTLLACCENIQGPVRDPMWLHMRGISAVFESIMWSSNQLSPTASAIAYWHWIVTFQQPVAEGRPSIFDSVQWWNVDPAGCSNWTPDRRRLRKLSHQLFCRLPRLVLLIRSLRQSTASRSATSRSHIYSQACHLAQELLLVVDDNVESAMLHEVNVSSTSDPADALVVPVSLNFHSLGVYETLMFYWQTRMILSRLCLSLSPTDFDTDALKTSNSRIARDLMMSMQYSFYIGYYGTKCLRLGIVVLWGVLSDMQDFRGLPTSVAKTWVLQKYNRLLRRSYDDSTMDEAAEVLCGGPLKGFLVEPFV